MASTLTSILAPNLALSSESDSFQDNSEPLNSSQDCQIPLQEMCCRKIENEQAPFNLIKFE